MTVQRVFVLAGEKSGDQQALPVVEALQGAYPNALFEGIGGPFLQKVGVQPFLPFSSFQVMGLTDVLKNLPKQWRSLRQIAQHILVTKPDLLLLVDYPGFNLRLAKKLRKKGYKGKIVYYICPKVWAWGQGRIPHMVRDLDLLLTIFPFEVGIFANTSLPCRYVGNPLVRTIRQYSYTSNWRERVRLPPEEPLISLFPGSRKGEIERNFPPMLEAAAAQNEEAVFAFSCADPLYVDLLTTLYRQSPLHKKQPPFFVPHQYRYELMRESGYAIAKSGTVNLELALHKTPTVVTYALTRLNKWFAKYILRLRLPYYSIVNILLQKEVFPELIARGCTKELLLEELERFDREQCRSACLQIQHLLENRNTGQEALQAIRHIL